MPRIKDQAVCIRHFDWSETSQVVALLTRDHGKVRGLAKGSKRTSPGAVARFSGGIDLLTGGQIVAVVKPSTDLATLTEWDLQDPYPHLRRNLAAQRIAMYGADLANALLADHDDHPRSYAALTALLTELTDDNQHDAALLRYQWALLDDGGYRPQLDQDASTGEVLQNQATYSFNALAGGITASTSRGTKHDGPGPWAVRRETVQVLRTVADGRPDSNAAAQTTLRRANRLLCVYARSILDRQLPTMDYVLSG